MKMATRIKEHVHEIVHTDLVQAKCKTMVYFNCGWFVRSGFSLQMTTQMLVYLDITFHSVAGDSSAREPTMVSARRYHMKPYIRLKLC